MRSGIAGSLSILFWCSCSNPRITTTWKTAPQFQERYYRILVIAILPEADSLLRKTIEIKAVKSLSAYAYYAVSAFSAYGSNGLTVGSQENTYLKLCNHGIDVEIVLKKMSKDKIINKREIQLKAF
jgi:uncharacterized protein YdaL